MARREAVTDRNDTSTKARNKRVAEPVELQTVGDRPPLPAKFVTDRGDNFVGEGRSTIARVRESRAVRRAEKRLAARVAGNPGLRGYHTPGSKKYR